MSMDRWYGGRQLTSSAALNHKMNPTYLTGPFGTAGATRTTSTKALEVVILGQSTYNCRPNIVHSWVQQEYYKTMQWSCESF